MSSSNRNAGFTMVELLTVMAIISIIAGITVSSLRFSEAVNITAAGNAVSDIAALARQNSISQDDFTAIVVQTSGANAYNAYCLIQLQRDPVSGSFTGSTWQPLTSWRRLGTGIAFDPSAAVTGSANFLAASGSLMGASASLSYQGQPVNVASGTIFQVFRPDGTLGGTQPLRLRVVRGMWNSSAASVSYLGPMNGATPSNYYDVVFLQDTGLTKIQLP